MWKNLRRAPAVLAILLALFSSAIARAQEPQSSIVVTPEENMVRWQEGTEVIISPVQREGFIIRPRVIVEWEDPRAAGGIDVENLRGPRGEITVGPVVWGDNVVRPKNVTVEWENVPVMPSPLPQASERKAIPVENVRPPDLIVPKENFENLSPWQSYVTPWAPAVRELAWRLKSVEEAYQAALRWVWVSDRTLHGVEERWLYPQEFLADSPLYPTNPVRGMQASDCESQAYTLVSVIRSMGMPPENVRVAVGKVQFGDRVGGHAWAEIYVYGRWLQLEATSGPYWDDENLCLVERQGISYDYFGMYEYPALEVWAYFNDVYYYNTMTGEGNAPEHWHTFRWTPAPDVLRLLVIAAVTAAVCASLLTAFYRVFGRKRDHGKKARGLRLFPPSAEPLHVFQRELQRSLQSFR
ncbi:MAG: transglutaminase domain-containing protein [Candidatus Hadarchaeales archaeon]